MLKEFKAFILTGNVVEFAVAVIMATAIGGVVKGFVSNIIMPLVGLFTGGVSFADKKYVLVEAVGKAGDAGFVAENAITYGAWVDAIINLLIVGMVMFMIVKGYNKMKKPAVEEAPAAPAGPSDNDLLKEILEALKK